MSISFKWMNFGVSTVHRFFQFVRSYLRSRMKPEPTLIRNEICVDYVVSRKNTYFCIESFGFY